LLNFAKTGDEMGHENDHFNFRLDSSNFNIDNGYLEGIVRGFKSGILKQADYLNLSQCDSLDGESRELQRLAETFFVTYG